MLLVLLTIHYFFTNVSGLSCLDNNGNPQPWSAFVKLPRVAGATPDPGRSYQLFTPDTQILQLSPKPLNISSPLTYTLDQLNQDPSISFVFYK